MHTPQGDIYRNPNPGSVIYSQFASRDLLDFYLVAQKTELGSASPVQYRMIYYHPEGQPFPAALAKADLPLEAIAQLTYEQCYNYYNWTGTVRVPAVMQYVRKLSKLAGEHLKRSVNRQEIAECLKHTIQQSLGQANENQRKEAYRAALEPCCRSILNSFYFL